MGDHAEGRLMGKAYGFSRGRKREVRVNLPDVERSLLLSLAEQLVAFVGPEPASADADPLATMVGIDATAETPEDPALARLLPDAFLDDPDAAAEFRRFTERDLRATKVAHSSLVIADLEAQLEVLPDDHLAAWLGFLNDARLALGTRLEITEDNHDELAGLPDEDPRAGMFQVYDWLTYLQDSLVQLLLP
jgi:hypothetical protein